MFFTGKVTSRKITNTGNFLFDVNQEIPAAKAGEPSTFKNWKAMLTPDQMAAYKMLDLSFPKVGETVQVEQSANPATGAVSNEWVSLCA